MPCIAVFTAHRPHSAKHKSRFINFEDDGYKVAPHVGLVETETAKDRRAHLLDVWRGKVQAATKFCVTTTVEPEDEWLHSFYYFNDTIPTEGDFVKTIGDYLTFEFSMVMQGREYLFEGSEESEEASGDTSGGTPPAAAPLAEGDGAPAPGAPPHHPQVSHRTAPRCATTPASLDAVKWGEFNLTSDDMFYIDPVPTFKSTSCVNQVGKYDVVGATSRNNGNVGFVSEENKHLLCQGNCICLIKTGQGSVGEAVYKNNAFIPSNNVYVIRSNWLKKCSALFVVTAINKQADRYSYGYIRNSKRVAREKVMLPTTPAGQPDYEFMEQYIRVHEATLIAGWRHYLGELEGAPATRALDAVKWGEFNFTDVFVIRGGFYNKKPPHEENGTIPFLGAVDNNNGVTAFYTLGNIEANSKTGDGKNEPLDRKIFDGNCICVTNDGSVGHAYYQIAKFTCSHSVNPLYLKQYPLNRYLALFLIKAIEQQAASFMYSRKWRPSRMKSSKILLPTTPAWQPDYEFMESYAKHLMATQYRRYLDYLERTGR